MRRKHIFKTCNLEIPMPTLLCFGDSNTYGTTPITDRDAIAPRLEHRWPVTLGNVLGWDIIEEGLPGRTFQFPCPQMGPHMDGRVGLFMALESHGPLDAIAIMLGTNDQKDHFEASPEDIVAGAAFFLDVCLSDEMQMRHAGFEPILIAPPRIALRGPFAADFSNAADKTDAVTAGLKALADNRDVAFFDAGAVVESDAVDGIHFNQAAHIALGKALGSFILSEIEDE
jgi:lysophospholipase L1-like esterase